MDTPASPAAPVDDKPASPTDGESPKAKSPEEEQDALNEKIEKDLQERLKKSKDARKERLGDWRANIAARMGQSDNSRAGGLMSNAGTYSGTIEDSGDLQSSINPDWSLTKMKTANLFSQLPTVQGTHETTAYAPAVPPFMKALNYELGEKRTNMAASMEEVLSDVVNASGIAAIYVDYQARFVHKRMPVMDPRTLPPEAQAQLPQLMEAGVIPSKLVPQVADYRFGATRISPRDLLTPADFTGSCFDDADWGGYDGRLSWADAQNTWLDDQQHAILDDTERETLTTDPEAKGEGEDLRMGNKSDRLDLKKVHFSHLFYWRHKFDADETCFSCIWEIVFVKGREEPVLHRPWKGQQKDPQSGKYIGAQKFPVRVLTLTYITDNPIPPSDTQAGRPQVNDLRLSRSQLFMNRAFSVPIRGFDVNRVDPMVADQLMRSVVPQGMIPFQGNGEKAMWELARASYPKEDLTFDQETQADLYAVWGFGGMQSGQSQHRQTKQESQTYANQFQTLFGQDRNKVARFFIGTVEVLAGLMCLYSDFPNLTPQERQQMEQAWDRKHILHDLVLSILPDSQIVYDAAQMIDRKFKVLNMVGKSGFVNPKPIIADILEYAGINPAEVMVDPKPKPPDEPAIGFRFSGKEDLQNPIVLALLKQLGKAPSPEMVEEAKRALLAAQMPAQPPSPDPQQQPGKPHQPPQKVPPAPDVQFEEAPVVPGLAGQPSAHPDWSGASKVIKRERDV